MNEICPFETATNMTQYNCNGKSRFEVASEIAISFLMKSPFTNVQYAQASDFQFHSSFSFILLCIAHAGTLYCTFPTFGFNPTPPMHKFIFHNSLLNLPNHNVYTVQCDAYIMYKSTCVDRPYLSSYI